MDCGPEFFAMMSFQAAYYNMSDFRVICFFFLFLFVHQVQFKFKNFISSWGPPLLHGLEICQFATHCCQHACTDTPQDEAEWRGKSCTILSGKVLFLPFHTLCFPYVLQDTHLTVMALTLNDVTEQLDPVNSMPEKVQQNMFWAKLICLNHI